MTHRVDEELIVRAGGGDREAFGELVERYHCPVMHFVQRFVGNLSRDAAEDLSQDVFLAAWKAAPGFSPRAKVVTWLFRIATNICLNHRRASRLRRFLTLQSFEPMDDRSSGDEFERGAAVRAAIAKLPTRQRAAIVLKHYHEFTYAQIAETLELSVPAVESLLFRARKVLRGLLAPDGGIPDSPQVLPEPRA